MMKPWHQYTEEGIAELATEALNVAVAHIQDKLGVDTGDFAGLYFSGNRQGAMEAVFKQYIEQEIHWNQETTL